MCGNLNELGFIAYLGGALSAVMGGWGAPAACVTLVFAAVVLHYMFVSQTAHLLALFGVFLAVGVKTGLPAALLAYQLLFANNYFSGLTPQASSANVLFATSGLISRDLMRPRRHRDGVQHGGVLDHRHAVVVADHPMTECT